MKTCNKCAEPKSEDDFYVHGVSKAGKVWLKGLCKPCHRAASSANSAATYEARGRFRSRRNHLRRLYGLTPEQFEAMLVAQNGCCAICGSNDAGARHRQFAVDHDHATGKVRELLCFKCNRRLAVVEDGEWMLNAQIYLHRHGSVRP